MRTLNPSLALASLVGFLTAASCTLITDVDRTKIPTDAGAEAGAPGTGGTTETGGTGGTVETGGTMQTGGTAGMGEAGQGAGGKGGKGGTGGENMGGAGETSTGGSAGAAPVTPVCDHATGSISIAPMTFFAEKDTFSIGDGIHPAVVFEIDFNGDGVAAGHVEISLTGSDQFVNAGLITDAINAQEKAGALGVTATFLEAAPVDNGEGGAAGAGGVTGSSGNGSAGAAPAPNPATDTAHINLVNDLAGALGNVKINKSKSASIGQGVGNSGFKVSGMSGGNAVECASSASCTTADECASGQCGDDNVCVPQ